MKLLTASFFRCETEILNGQEIRFEEISDPATGEITWFGEFYLNKQPSFKSEVLKMVLSDGRCREVKAIVSNFTQGFYFVSFRSLLQPPVEIGSEHAECQNTADFKCAKFR